jgi:hypothetical protein
MTPRSVLQQFACPVCGRVREISVRVHRAIADQAASGECRPGHGCRSKLSQEERFRRFWLNVAGVTPLEIRRAGGAVPFVLEFGLPSMLAEISHSFPVERDAPARPSPRSPHAWRPPGSRVAA